MLKVFDRTKPSEFLPCYVCLIDREVSFRDKGMYEDFCSDYIRLFEKYNLNEVIVFK